MSTEPEIVCTLEGAGFAERLVWIRQLFSRHLVDRQEEDLVLRLTLAPEAADDVDELVRRERACCAFLDFEVIRSAESVRLNITAPEAARESASFIFSAFDRAGADEPDGAPQTPCPAQTRGGFLNSALKLLAQTCSCEAATAANSS